MEIVKGLALLVIGFALLVKGADVFVDGASGLAKLLGVPPLVVGLTVVAMGTSAPEAAVSISSGLKDATGIAIGNVLGSNLMSVLVILGLTAVIVEVPIQTSTFKIEIPFTIGITVLLLVLGLPDGRLSRFDAGILVACFVVYLIYTVVLGLKEGSDEEPEDPKPLWMLAAFLVLGAACIVFGSNFVVDGATGVARVFGVSERVIGLTIVALGTSLPELVTSVTAATRKEADIAIGNIVGSNIFNILFVLGLAGVLNPIPFEEGFLLDGILATAAVVLLWIACIRTRSLRRIWGAIMLLFYVMYLANLLFM